MDIETGDQILQDDSRTKRGREDEQKYSSREVREVQSKKKRKGRSGSESSSSGSSISSVSSQKISGISQVKISEALSALQEYVENRQSKSLPTNKIVEFYNAYPEFKNLFKGQLKAIVNSSSSSLYFHKDQIRIKKSSKSRAADSPEKSCTENANLTDSPGKIAARAARFASMNQAKKNVAIDSDYQRTFKENQRVAEALEMAEKSGGEVDWDSLVLKGTCQTLEKSYVRLTAPPDPSTVRPENILTKSLDMIMNRLHDEGQAAYAWASDQLKSIRVDLRVQHIQNKFTIKVYEFHARSALKYGNPDFQEFNQCMTQLLDLYASGLGNPENKLEFASYSILYHLYCKVRHNSNSSKVELSLFRPKSKAMSDPEFHAYTLYLAMESQNWIRFLRLYFQTKYLGKDLLKPIIPYVRLNGLRICCVSSKSLSASYLRRTFHFGSDGEFEQFCKHFNIGVSDDNLIDSKLTLQQINNVFSEGTVWT